MSGSLAEVLAAIGIPSLVGGLLLGLRGIRSDRFERDVNLVRAQRQEIGELREQHRSDIEALRLQHAADRAAWDRERQALREQHAADMAAERAEWEAEKRELRAMLADQREEVETLKAQVYALMTARAPQERP